MQQSWNKLLFLLAYNDCISTTLVDIYPIWAGINNIVVIFQLPKHKTNSLNIQSARKISPLFWEEYWGVGT